MKSIWYIPPTKAHFQIAT